MTDWLILNKLFHIDCLGFSVGRIGFFRSVNVITREQIGENEQRLIFFLRFGFFEVRPKIGHF